jgi:hypothetical protein
MTDTSQELERLQKLKAELESRLVAVEDEQKTVEENVKILREKVAIRELEKKAKEKRDVVVSLRIEKKELEDKLKEPNKLSMSDAVLIAKVEIENKKDKLETQEEEPSKVVGEKDEKTLETDETSEEQEKKKKLRFF